MKTKLFVLTTILFTGLFIAGPAFSQCNHDKKAGEHKGCVMDELSPEQKAKIETIKADSDKKIVNYKADLKIKKAELDKLKIAENPSKKDIDAKIDEISVLKANIEKEKVNRHLLIREQLTPEQRVKFDQMHAKKDKAHGCDHGKADAGEHKGCDKSATSHSGCKDGQHNNGGEGQMHKDCQKSK
ncbi:MAG: periplasmic heavy metal sensor [Bacteroidales bacterium]|nr:periplasmic heavy metal sensor [Bacteroidales bacterium]